MTKEKLELLRQWIRAEVISIIRADVSTSFGLENILHKERVEADGLFEKVISEIAEKA